MDRWRATLWGSFLDELEKIAGAPGPRVAQNMLRQASKAGPPQVGGVMPMTPPAPSPAAAVGIPRVDSTLGSTGRSTLVNPVVPRPTPALPQVQETYTMNQLGAGGPTYSASGPMNR